jgi:hypothetical protein
MGKDTKWVQFPLGTKYESNVNPVNVGPDGCADMVDIDPITTPGTIKARAGNENLIASIPIFPQAMTSYSHIGEVMLTDGTRRIVVLGDCANTGVYGVVFLYDPDTATWTHSTMAGQDTYYGVSELDGEGHYGDRSLVIFNSEVRAYGEKMLWWGKINYQGTRFLDNINGPLIGTDYVFHNNLMRADPLNDGDYNLSASFEDRDGNSGVYTGTVYYLFSYVFEDGQEGDLMWLGSHTVAGENSPANILCTFQIRDVNAFVTTEGFRVKAIKIYNSFLLSAFEIPKASNSYLIFTLKTRAVSGDTVSSPYWAMVGNVATYEILDNGANRVKTYYSETGISTVRLLEEESPTTARYINDLSPMRRYCSPFNDRFLFGSVEDPLTGVADIGHFYWSHISRYGPCYDIVRQLDQEPLGSAGQWRGAMQTRGYRIILGSTGFLVGQNIGISQSFKIDRAECPIGCIARNTIAQTPIGPIFLAQSGFYLIDGLDFIQIAHDMFADIRLYPDAAKALAMGAYSPRNDFYYFYIPEYVDEDNVTWPKKFYAFHIATKSVLPRNPSGNGTIYAIASDVRNGVIAGCKSAVGVIEICRLECRYGFMDLPNNTPDPMIKSGYRHFGGHGFEHAAKEFNILIKSGVPTDISAYTIEPEHSYIGGGVDFSPDEFLIRRLPLSSDLPPAMWTSIKVEPKYSLNDTTYVITENPPSSLDDVPKVARPPQGNSALDWEFTQAHLRVIESEREME